MAICGAFFAHAAYANISNYFLRWALVIYCSLFVVIPAFACLAFGVSSLLESVVTTIGRHGLSDRAASALKAIEKVLGPGAFARATHYKIAWLNKP